MVMSQGGTTERMKEKVRHLMPCLQLNVELKTTLFVQYQEVSNPAVKYFMSVLMDLQLSPDIHVH